MMVWQRSLQALTGLTLLALPACSGHKKAADPAPTRVESGGDALPVQPPGTTTPASPLLGTWHGSCVVTGDTAVKDLLVFQGDMAIAARTHYSDAKCQSMTFTSTLQGKFINGAVNASGSNDLDLLYNQETETYPTRDAVAAAVTAASSGDSARCTGQMQPTVSGTLIDYTPCLKDPGLLYQYTVYTLTNGQLHLAVPGAEPKVSGKAAGTRALQLDSGLDFTKD